MKYAAIDFETASASPDSACSIGIVKMDEEGAVIDSFYSLVSPPRHEFDPRCFAIHHLDPAAIMAAPTMALLWPEIKDFIGDLPLVAHNAPFDIKVLRSTLQSWNIECIHNEYYCTLSLSRKLWKGRPSYKLTSLAASFGWKYEAHNALADSEICGRLFSRLFGSALFDDDVAKRFFSRIYRDKSYPKRV